MHRPRTLIMGVGLILSLGMLLSFSPSLSSPLRVASTRSMGGCVGPRISDINSRLMRRSDILLGNSRKLRGRDIGDPGKVNPWLTYDDYMKREKGDGEEGPDDGIITEEDTYLILEGYHPSMSPEDVREYKQEQAELREKEAEAAAAAKLKPKKRQRGASKINIEDRPKINTKYRYRGVDMDTGYALHHEQVVKGPISDYYDPWDLFEVSTTQGFKPGMHVEQAIIPRGLDPFERSVELQKMLRTNYTVKEPFTGYAWNYTTNLTLASEFSWRGKPLVTGSTEGRLLAMTAVDLDSGIYKLKKRKSGGKSKYDQIALYVDVDAGRRYFGDVGAQMIPLDETAHIVPPPPASKNKLTGTLKKVLQWYFRGWPERLNPIPPQIQTRFSRKDIAYGKAFLAGKFSKRLVIKFGGKYGIRRWMDLFETMRGECNVKPPPQGGASEAYRFEKMMESIDAAATAQEELRDGELIMDFDSQNRMTLSIRRGSKYLLLPLEDPDGAFQGREAEAFRACELLLGALFQNHDVPFAHLKSIFIGAAKQIFTQPDKELSLRTELEAVERLLNSPQRIMTEDMYDQEISWNTEYEMRTEKAPSFEALSKRVADHMRRPDYVKMEALRTRDEDRSRSQAYRRTDEPEEEDPYEVAKRLSAEKQEIKNPIKMPKSYDGGLTYRFEPVIKEDNVESIEFKGEMADRERELKDIESEFESKLLARALISYTERNRAEELNKTLSEKEAAMQKEGYMFIHDYFPRRPDEAGPQLINLDAPEAVENYYGGEEGGGFGPDLGDDFPSMDPPSGPPPAGAEADPLAMLMAAANNVPAPELPPVSLPPGLGDDFPSMDPKKEEVVSSMAPPAGLGFGEELESNPAAGLGFDLDDGAADTSEAHTEPVAEKEDPHESKPSDHEGESVSPPLHGDASETPKEPMAQMEERVDRSDDTHEKEPEEEWVPPPLFPLEEAVKDSLVVGSDDAEAPTDEQPLQSAERLQGSKNVKVEAGYTPPDLPSQSSQQGERRGLGSNNLNQFESNQNHQGRNGIPPPPQAQSKPRKQKGPRRRS